MFCGVDVIDGRGARPSELITLLGLDPGQVHIIRRETRLIRRAKRDIHCYVQCRRSAVVMSTIV